MKKHSLAGLDTGCWTAPLLRPMIAGRCHPAVPLLTRAFPRRSQPANAPYLYVSFHVAESVRILALSLLLTILLGAPLSAEDNPLKWASHRKLADTISTGAVGAQIAGQALTNWNGEHRKHDMLVQGCATGLSILAAELTKQVVHRTRPDGSNDRSFFSEHTAIATANAGWNLRISIPISVGTGYGRMAANKHFATDVLTGAAVGLFANAVCKGDVWIR
jgi:membrane-associated phospholipid phosphatase